LEPRHRRVRESGAARAVSALDAFRALSSHTRTHGAPRGALEYDSAFVVDFRRAIELKYALMPYISRTGESVVGERVSDDANAFFEYPDDATSWLIEDEYFFGSDLLVAPLFDDVDHRQVYLPPGTWIDYQTGRAYAGAAWHDIRAGAIPIVLLVRHGAVIPHMTVAQHTAAMNWSDIRAARLRGPRRTPAPR
jgi:alpha-D-xyloside xylohydrolase